MGYTTLTNQLTLFEDLLPLDKKQENINQRKPEIKSQRDKDIEAHYTKDDRGNSTGAFKKFVKDERAKKEEKPFHIFNPVTQELDNVNDPNYLKPKTQGPIAKEFSDSKMGKWIDHNKYQYGDGPKPKNYDPNYIEKVNKEAAAGNLTSIVETRDETPIERQSRYSWIYGDGPKPKHYDDTSIKKVDTFKGLGKAMPVIKENGIYKKQKPTSLKPFSNYDKSTWTSNPKVKANLNAWELLKASANTLEEKADIKRILLDDYKKGNARHMNDADLKLIKKGKYIEYPKIEIPKVEPTPVISEPAIPLEVRIKQMADNRLKLEQQEYDRRYGTGGIVLLKRPE